MIQQEDTVDRKLIALATRFKTATTRLIDKGIDETFFEEKYRLIVQSIFAYYKVHFELLTPDVLADILGDQQADSTQITVNTAYLDDIRHDPDLVEGESALTELDYFITKIRRRKAENRLKVVSREIAQASMSGRVDTGREAMMRALSDLDGIDKPDMVVEGTLAELVEPRLQKYEDRKNNPDMFKGIQSGFPHLDNITDGFQPGQLILYVAESGGGKSVSMLHSAFHAWLEKFPGSGTGANVVLFSLEMDWEQYLRRFDAMHVGLDSYKLKSASLEDHEYGQWREALHFQKEKDNFFYIVDCPSSCTTLFIRNKLDEIRRKYPNNPIDLICIDYMGIMETPKKVDGDWLRQGYISQESKELARGEKVPVISAVQETRDSIKDTKSKSKNTAVLSRSQMIPANADLIIYGKLHVREDNEDDFENMFDGYNNDPNMMLYELVKARDAKKIKWRVGVDFSRMFLQPLDLEDEETIEVSNPGLSTDSAPAPTKAPAPVASPKKEEPTLSKESLSFQEDEKMFEDYYERMSAA